MPLRILVVDDYPSNLKILARMLLPWGSSELADSGGQAVALHRQALATGKPFDIVFLDIEMPNGDGNEALASIRAAEEAKGIVFGDGAKVVMTTAHDDIRHVLVSFREGCQAYVVKPVTVFHLERVLADLGLPRP